MRLNCLHYLSSYLTSLIQFVGCKGYWSKTLVATSDVPQGSILRPFILNVYINDMFDNFKCDYNLNYILILRSAVCRGYFWNFLLSNISSSIIKSSRFIMRNSLYKQLNYWLSELIILNLLTLLKIIFHTKLLLKAKYILYCLLHH